MEYSKPGLSQRPGSSAAAWISRALLLALLFTASVAAHAATVVPLNDTGQTLCYPPGTGGAVSCATVADDGHYGRDAANTAGVLTKTGAGNAGFDFSKIANNGTTLAAGAALGTAATDWACTRDNVTGLTWEVKTTSGLRSSSHTYTWYSTDAATNGGNAGSLGTDTCGGTLSAYSNQCNTANYVAAVNATALCGYSDWRLPSLRELQSLVDFGVPASPFIDTSYFPNTQINWYGTANTVSQTPTQLWSVPFYNTLTNPTFKAQAALGYFRLVRGVQ